MKLLLNGRELPDILPEQTALGAALRTIQDEQVPSDEVIARILVDGEPLSADQLLRWKDRPLKDFQETRIEARPKAAYAGGCLRTLADALEQSGDIRNQISDLLCKGRGGEAMKILQEYIGLWLGIQQSLHSAAHLLEINLDAVEIFTTGGDTPRPVIDYINALAGQLSEIKNALQAGDMILVGDILDYEFGAITADWQTLLRQLADRFDPAA
jgi:hypothetical protein